MSPFARLLPRASIVALACACSTLAQAASSGWHHVEGGAIRIVTSGEPGPGGHLRGALEIRLKPGWKTYWLDPGASGVPPTLTASAGDKDTAVAIGFPPPRRFDDGYAPWAGYDHPVSLALTIALPQRTPARLDASVFLGVCETICIPVAATLSFDPRDGTHAPEDAKVVKDAFAALPAPARPGFSAAAARVGDDEILIETALPAGARVLDLFVAGSATLALGTPERQGAEPDGLFRVPVALRTGDHAEEVAYTLVTDAGAVSGTMELPPR